jgi:hypothetical protein
MIFYAMNTGLLVFFIVGIYLNDMTVPGFSQEVDILTIINLLLLVSIPAGYTISARPSQLGTMVKYMLSPGQMGPTPTVLISGIQRGIPMGPGL